MLHISDLVTKTRWLTNSDSTSLANADLLISFNSHYDRTIGKILSETAGSKFLHGDVNYTSFPTYTQDLTAGTSTYRIQALATGTYPSRTEPLIILGVEVLNSSGNYIPLDRITLREIHKEKDLAPSEYLSTNGMPREYEIREGLIVLYPAPAAASVTTSAGLRVFYLRGAEQLESADLSSTTIFPGIPSPWHDILAFGAAYDYALKVGLPNTDRFLREYNARVEEMLDFLSRKDQAEEPRMSGHITGYR